MVEEGRLDSCGGQGLGKDMAHAAAGLQALHELSAGNQVRAVGDNLGQVDELSGEEDVEVVLLGKFIGLLCELVDLLAIQVGLGVNDEERLPEFELLHVPPHYYRVEQPTNVCPRKLVH